MRTRLTVTLIMFFASMALAATSASTLRAEDLGISNIVFCSSNPKGYMDYEEQPDATFKPGQVVWIYMNLDHIKTNTNPDGTKEMWIKLHLKVKSPNGDVLLNEDLYNEHKNFPERSNMNEMFLRVNLNTVPQMAEGRYTVKLLLRDELAKKEASASSIFTLKP